MTISPSSSRLWRPKQERVERAHGWENGWVCYRKLACSFCCLNVLLLVSVSLLRLQEDKRSDGQRVVSVLFSSTPRTLKLATQVAIAAWRAMRHLCYRCAERAGEWCTYTSETSSVYFACFCVYTCVCVYVFAHRIDGDGGCLPMSRSLAIRGKRQESPFSCASYFCHLKVSFFFSPRSSPLLVFSLMLFDKPAAHEILFSAFRTLNFLF